MEHLNGNSNDSIFGRFWVKGCKGLTLQHFNANRTMLHTHRWITEVKYLFSICKICNLFQEPAETLHQSFNKSVLRKRIIYISIMAPSPPCLPARSILRTI